MALYYDILLDADGDLPIITRHVKGAEVVAQRVKFRLETFEGEWILDTAVGLPYIRWRGEKVVNLNSIGARIQREISETDGVVRIISFSGSFDTEQQIVRFSMQLEVEDLDDSTAVTDVTYYPFGPQGTNINPIALYTAPSKTVL